MAKSQVVEGLRLGVKNEALLWEDFFLAVCLAKSDRLKFSEDHDLWKDFFNLFSDFIQILSKRLWKSELRFSADLPVKLALKL